VIELKFETKKDVDLAVNKLSQYGKVDVFESVETKPIEKIYLISNYEDASYMLKELSLKEINNYTIPALELVKNLFESGELSAHRQLDQTKINDSLYKIASETNNYKYLDYLSKQESYNKEINKLKKKFIENMDYEIDKTEFAVKKISKINETQLNKDKLELNNFINQFIVPIYNSIEIHFKSNDPYSSFMNEVYLDVTDFSDNFETSDLKVRLETDIVSSFTVNLGLEFVLLEDEFFYLIQKLTFKNNEVSPNVNAINVLTNFIIEYIQNVKKMEYVELIEQLYQEINQNLIDLGDLEILFRINKTIIEWIVKELARINMINIIGEKIVINM
jgi:hypothetical protein